jgi:hypothetical protein
MSPSASTTATKLVALLWVGSMLTLSGCGRDAALTAKITGAGITNSPVTTASPVVPTPPGVEPYRGGSIADVNSQGGIDGATGHVSSGSVSVSKVSVGGDVQKRLGTSASYRVSGGIYVQ